MKKPSKRIVRGLREAVAHARGDKVAGIRIHIPQTVNVLAVRRQMGLSQAAFSQRIGVSTGTLRNWEQGRRKPEGPARVLLALLQRNPRIVQEVLHYGVHKKRNSEHDIDVYRVPLAMEGLKRMSNEERALFFLIGYAENQIALMQKLVIFLTNADYSDQVEQKVAAVQTQIIVRSMIGIIFETWEKLIKARLLPRLESGQLKIKLNERGKTTIAELKNHFGQSSLLSKIRNSFAFHYPNDEYMNKAFKAASRSEDLKQEWNWYLANERTNTCYFASDVVLFHGIMEAAGGKSLAETQQKLMHEAQKVHGLLADFFDAVMEAFMKEYFPPQLTGYRTMVRGAPNLYEFSIPFYAATTEIGKTA